MTFNRIITPVLFVFGILCWLYYIGMGLAVRFGQSLLWLWPAVGTFCIVRFFVMEKHFKSKKPLPWPEWITKAFRVCVALGLCVFLFAEFFICFGAYNPAPEKLDAIIVLGARINGDVPSGALIQRFTAAAEYLNANPDTLCIASGGQGDDEAFSEAKCIRDNLVCLGVSPDRIILEDKSTDTVENMRYSLPMLEDGMTEIGICTNDFHIFRAMAVARHQSDLNFYGVPARSTYYGFVHYAMREFFGLGEGILKGELSF